MQNKLVYIVLAFVAAVILSAKTTIFAGTTAADVIKMQDKAYEHKKGIVEFSHKKHSEQYKAGCGDCHHDDKGKPLTTLKAGDDVKKCIECHKKPSEKPKGKDAPKLSDKERREYHAEAMHENCIECHKKANKAKNLKPTDKTAAPVTCNNCHPK